MIEVGQKTLLEIIIAMAVKTVIVKSKSKNNK